MPNLGPTELLIVFALVMVLFGANRLPKFARSLGEAQRELRQGYTETTEETDTPA